MNSLKLYLQLYLNDPAGFDRKTLIPDDYGGFFLPVEKAIDQCEQVLDFYLRMHKFSCCKMPIGLALRVGPYNFTGDHMDHYWNLGGWYSALSSLQRQVKTKTFVHDQSSLVLEKAQDRLTLWDAHQFKGDPYASNPDRSQPWQPITIDFMEFQIQLMREGRFFQQFCSNLTRCIGAKGHPIGHLRTKMGAFGEKPVIEDEDHAAKLAIILREVEGAKDVVNFVEAIQGMKI